MWTVQSVSTKGQRQHCCALVKPRHHWRFIRQATIHGTHIKRINSCQIFRCHSQTTNHPLRTLHSEWIINQFSHFDVCDPTLLSKCQGKRTVVTDQCICLWDSKHQDKNPFHIFALYRAYNRCWTDPRSPLKGGGSDGGADGAVSQVRHYRHVITTTSTARWDHKMINFTSCQRLPAGGSYSICLYVKPWWLSVHSICNLMQAPGGEGVLPTALEQQRNQLQVVACVGAVQRKRWIYVQWLIRK